MPTVKVLSPVKAYQYKIANQDRICSLGCAIAKGTTYMQLYDIDPIANKITQTVNFCSSDYPNLEVYRQRLGEHITEKGFNKVKMLEKVKATYMEALGPDFNTYHEVEVIKNCWECLSCGLVWNSRRDSQICEHVGSYTRTYGGYIENGIRRYGKTYTIRAIRREKI